MKVQLTSGEIIELPQSDVNAIIPKGTRVKTPEGYGIILVFVDVRPMMGLWYGRMGEANVGRHVGFVYDQARQRQHRTIESK